MSGKAVTPDLTSDDQESVTDRGYGPDASGIDVLGRQSKALIETINRLQSLGVEVNDLTLPKIIVVGDQSAGKSSVRLIYHSFTIIKKLIVCLAY